jgi:magnesium-transporting ATPase (P-type)
MSFVRASVDVDTTDENGKVNAADTTSTAGILIEALPKTVNLIVVLVVVAIPEGLPLTIQISLAFSVMRMFKKDSILLRKQESLERIAEAN